MDLLEQLIGGGQQRQQYQEFTNRYDQGAPWQGISDQEALNHYNQIAPQLPPQLYQESAQEAFARLTPEQRMQLGQYLQQQAQQQGVGGLPGVNPGGMPHQFQDPGYLAQATSRMEQQQPGILGQLLGGALGGGMGGAMGGGPGGMAGGGMLESPIAKAALAGVAAMAVKRMMGGR
jgi:hypothetical protein